MIFVAFDHCCRAFANSCCPFRLAAGNGFFGFFELAVLPAAVSF